MKLDMDRMYPPYKVFVQHQNEKEICLGFGSYHEMRTMMRTFKNDSSFQAISQTHVVVCEVPRRYLGVKIAGGVLGMIFMYELAHFFTR